MTMKSDSALEAFAHCCTEVQLRDVLKTLPESGRERLKLHGHLALPRAMEFNKESAGVVRALLEQPELQVNLPHVGQDENTILHFAVLLQDKDVVRSLLDRDDLDPNVGNVRGECPVHVAVEKDSCADILKLLLSDSRVNIAALTSDKQTALHVACKSGNKCSAREVLDSAKAKVKSLPQFLKNVDGFGRTALHYAAKSGLDETIGKILDALGPLQSNNESNDHLALARDNAGCLAVHLAAQGGHLEAVQRLLDVPGGGDPEGQDGLTALHHAVGSGHQHIVEEFLKPELPLHEYRELPLHEYRKLLSLTTHSNIAKFLLKNLYNSHVKSERETSRRSLSHWAGKKEDVLVNPELLITQTLEWAVHENTEDRELLIEHILKWYPEKANMYVNLDKKQTLLHFATFVMNEKAVHALCNESAPWKLDGNQGDVNDHTALDYVFENKNETIRRILTERKDVKVHLDRLHKKRDAFMVALNVILVSAVLVATTTFSRCSTTAELVDELEDRNELAPGSAPRDEAAIYFTTEPIKIAFFLSMTSTILAAYAALPFSFRYFVAHTVPDDHYMIRTLHRARVLLILASYCLMVSLGAVMIAFICSQYILPIFAIRCLEGCAIAMGMFVFLAAAFVATNVVRSKSWNVKPQGKFGRLRTGRKVYSKVPTVKSTTDENGDAV